MPIDSLIFNAFGWPHNPEDSIVALEDGLIHKTYLVSASTGEKSVFQWVNPKVIPNIAPLESNFFALYGLQKAQDHVVLPLPSGLATFHVKDPVSQGSWRRFSWHSEIQSTNGTAEEAFACAHAFGAMAVTFSGLDLCTVFPEFHSLAPRLFALKNAFASAQIDPNKVRRSQEMKDIVADLMNWAPTYLAQEKWIAQESLVAVQHHDTKRSNVLFTKNGIRIIDLDTLQKGHWGSDFGDMVRSYAPTVSEDQPGQVDLKPFVHEALWDGYCSALGNFSTPKVLEALKKSGERMVFLQTVRFCTDYLLGDVYYTTQYAEQNAVRTKNQWLFLQALRCSPSL